jgi:type I restriction enzyme S subunit
MMRAPSSRQVLESLAASSAGQCNLSLGTLDRIELPLPSLAARDRVLEDQAGLDSQIARMQSSLAVGRRRQEALRRAWLAAEFPGRLTGRSSDADVVEERAGG